MLVNAKFDRSWGNDPRQNNLVFIGKNIERANFTERVQDLHRVKAPGARQGFQLFTSLFPAGRKVMI